MESVDVSGRTVEEAVQQALLKLGKERDEVEVTILSEGHRGILGFVRGVRGETAQVRVTVRQSEVAELVGDAEGEEELPETSAPKVPKVPSGVAVALAEETLAQLLEKMGIEADVAARGGTGTEDSPILLDVTGDDLGILIGRRGETLSSIQFLVNLMVGKHLDSWVRIVVDVEGYKARREETLRSLASRVAERVRRTGQTIALEPMPPNERRIVHMALQTSPYVTTESSGYGEDRRVSVMPKNADRSGREYRH